MPSLLSLLFLLLSALAPQDSRAALDQAAKLREAGKLTQAEEAYAAICEASPETGEAWFFLGYVRHASGDLEGAILAGQRAAEFPDLRATALYNVACAQSLAGQLDAAAFSLEEALAAGFADFDLMEVDADLAALRAAGSLPGPTVHAFQHKRSPNGVTVPYFILEPEGYDPERSYPAFLVFSPGAGTRAVDWAIDEFFGDSAAGADRLVVFVAPPERGWMTHPTHHALEDVLKRIKKSHKIEGSAFHFVGLLAGTDPALTYSLMSKRYAASVTVISCSGWSGYEDNDWRKWRGRGVHVIEGEQASTLAYSRIVHAKLLEHDVDAHLTVVPEAGPRVASLRGGELHRALGAVLPSATAGRR